MNSHDSIADDTDGKGGDLTGGNRENGEEGILEPLLPLFPLSTASLRPVRNSSTADRAGGGKLNRGLPRAAPPQPKFQTADDADNTDGKEYQGE